jgi:hypothetical protein
MSIIKFEDFINEQVKDKDIMVTDYTGKPNLKDPKTDKDFIELITTYLNVIKTKQPDRLKDPVGIAIQLRNLLTEYLDADGEFGKRSGFKLPKPLMVLNKKGEEKERGWAAKGK